MSGLRESVGIEWGRGNLHVGVSLAACGSGDVADTLQERRRGLEGILDNRGEGFANVPRGWLEGRCL